MLAGKDEYLQEASETIYRMSADELVRKHKRTSLKICKNNSNSCERRMNG